ncbi:hypothetical protein [Cypionkella sp.]|uniref:hypothetical protein n=1 Tax=Cypionkella sp. TaxID=2811411 RepID=UPI00271AEAB5|nr:hypothetical protein [Cypionkella sp.]MDO8984354.1 hypothetical protein [Cypionkella sp.]MDP2048027.1 hypothetical protein [Cypionkella sp.]
MNTYALFAEHFSRLTGPKGRAGIIVPTGIATEATTSHFFAELQREKRIANIFDFENRGHIFSSLHTKTKFCLLTISRAAVKQVQMCFMATTVSDVTDTRKVFNMEAQTVALFNPITLTLPILRSREDARILTDIYRGVPILLTNAESITAWHVNFGTMFHMSNDSDSFVNHSEICLLPLFEAKMFWHFDHRWSSFSDAEDEGAALNMRRDENYEPSPRYWIAEHQVLARLSEKNWSRKWMIASRNVSDSRNERTFVTAILPIGGLGHSGSVLALKNDDPALASCLVANFNSLVLDFVARQKIPGMNISYFMIEQFPILPPIYYTPEHLVFLTPRVLELTYTSHALAPFARDLGHNGPPFAWDEPRRAQLRAELDAFFARAYNLTRDDLRYILDPADVMGPTYPSETFRVLKDKETRTYGEYRTRRLVLSAWDAMAEDGTFKAMGM